jgi:bis(5'-nucleosyl)-tetraphosphatase (symmetrical)
MATYAVGDLQGCLTPLQELLKQVNFNWENDQLWLTGDLINRGGQSLSTLRFVHQHRDNIITILGNHDLHLLAIAEGVKQPSPSDTLNNILKASDRDVLLEWLRHRPLLHHDNKMKITMVHAGIPPQWSVKKALKRAQEVEKILRSRQYRRFFENMYGNKPNGWKKGMSDTERWRVITNYFTRMRFCSAEGKLELTAKQGMDQSPEGYLPWFAHSHRKTHNDRILFGHWAALEGHTGNPNAIALDTGYVWGKAMTMIRLEDLKIFRVEYHDHHL